MQRITELALERATGAVFTREQAALWIGSRGARLDALLKTLRLGLWTREFFLQQCRKLGESDHPA